MRASLSKRTIKFFILSLFLIWTLFPIYWMFSLAIREKGELFGALSLVPRSFSFEHFVDLFKTKAFGLSIMNSLMVTFVSLALALAFGLACAYVLARARFRFKLKGAMLFWVLLLRILPPIAFALPLYILMSDAGLLSTKTPLILSHLLINIPFIIWFMITFFEALPEEVEESAAVDGANEHQLFARIVMPQVLPGLTAVAILSFMTSWNEYLYSAIFVQSPSHFTIPLTLSTLNSEQELTQWGNIAAGGVLSLVPIALFVLFAQNFLIAGLSGGAVKE
jgi:multiple sugar transport system permease protein